MKKTTTKALTNKQKNAAFDKLSKAEKRVAIAKDVLAQMSANKIRAERGLYVNKMIPSNKLGSEVCDLNPMNTRGGCNACALGSMFLCAVDKHDKLKVGDLEEINVYGPDGIHQRGVEIFREDTAEYLGKFFSQDQLNQIELAFESGRCPATESASDDNATLRLIMENIIANKGTFKPDKEPVTTTHAAGYIP